MSHRNLLFLMSDEHSRKVTGFGGNPVVRTPTLDRLAAAGTHFPNAYCTSPICVPARASIATGRYIFETGYWDNADAYDGRVRSWHHALRDAGHPLVAIGKLHFRDATCDLGFTDIRLPMYIPNGEGDVLGLLRDEPRERSGARKLAALAGPGESDYTTYDRAITREAVRWIERDGRAQQRPWALFVSMVTPHFPLIAPKPFFDMYDGAALPMPKLYAAEERPHHPALDFYRETFTYDRYFESPDAVRRALAAYYGLVSFVDDNIRQVVAALERSGLLDTTDILYTSDHGDNLGSRGLWGKSTMYEEAVGVPLLLSGRGYAGRGRRDELVSHIDLMPFIVEHFGLQDSAGIEQPATIRRHSFARDDFAGETRDRPVLAEYHATGSKSATFMLRQGAHKLIHHVDGPIQYFDLAADPEELVDRARDADAAPERNRLAALLESVIDPRAVDARAKGRQAELRSIAGGDAAILARQDYGYSPVPAEALVPVGIGSGRLPKFPAAAK